jgi:hypothetical protein
MPSDGLACKNDCGANVVRVDSGDVDACCIGNDPLDFVAIILVINTLSMLLICPVFSKEITALTEILKHYM